MELRVLNYFLMVAREENITKAANILHVTQPTLSRQLIQLEKELGVQLFIRSSHNVSLTEEGMLLKRRAKELLSLAEKTKQEILQEKEQVSGVISIGSGEMLSMSCFAQMLSEFREQYPQVKFDIFSGNADNIKERIDKGLIDLALFMEPVDMAKYDFIRMPIKEEWGILVREDSPLAERTSICPQDLVGTPIMISNRELVRSVLLDWFGKYADRMDIVVTHNLQYNPAVMAQQGMGAVVGLRLAGEYDSLRFVPLSSNPMLGSVLAWKKNQIFSKAAEALIEYASRWFSTTDESKTSK